MNKDFQHWMESQLIEVMKLKMQMIQFVSIVILIQMKSMKVNNNMKNISNKEFQHLMESQLIQVMNMKMQMIQFVSIVILIQMKLMKVIYMMNKEFQYHLEYDLLMILKNYESICDEQYQSKDLFHEQMCCSHAQS
jgi:hypothetical protein